MLPSTEYSKLKRSMLDQWFEIHLELLPDNDIKIINCDQRNIIGKCHNYSFFRIFSNSDVNTCKKDLLSNFSSITFENANIIRDLLFIKTNIPQHGDLAVYKDDSEYDTHYGIYINPHNQKSYEIESKWGYYSKIIRHAPDSVPLIYGNNIYFYKLKNSTKSSLSTLRSAHNYAKHLNFISYIGKYVILPLIIWSIL